MKNSRSRSVQRAREMLDDPDRYFAEARQRASRDARRERAKDDGAETSPSGAG